MKRPVLRFEWYNTKYNDLTNYEKLVFNNIVSQLSMETTDFIPEEMLITTEVNDLHLYIRCYGVNVELIKGYFRDFPFMSDINFIGKPVNGGILVKRKELKVKPTTIQEFSYSSMI